MDIVIGERPVGRGQWEPFGLTVADRRRHMLLIGRTGSGKSRLLRNLIAQDLEAGRGLLLLDPHGGLAEEMLDLVPPWRTEDLIYFNPADLAHPIGFNVMERLAQDDRPLVAASIVSTFEHLWHSSWGVRSAYILLNVVSALLEFPPSRGNVTLLGVPRMLGDDAYRAQIIKEVRDPRVRAFWDQEFARWPASFRAEALAPLQNKAGSLFVSPALRHVLGQAGGKLRMREAMERQRIVLCNLSKGRLGESASNLLGSLLIAAVQLSALNRATIPEDERSDFALYIDEFSNFGTDYFASILAESRKYRLGLVLVSQYLASIQPAVRAAIFGNIGTIVSFGLGHADAAELAIELTPTFSPSDLLALGTGEIAVRLSDGGRPGRPFSGETIQAWARFYGNRARLIEQSRRRYGRRREVVERKLTTWFQSPQSQAF